MNIKRGIAMAVLGGSAAFVAGCSPRLFETKNAETASTAPWPTKVERAASIEDTLACMRNSGALSDVVFAVGPWVDSTGKINAVAQGSTGAFLPQAGTASFVTDTVRQAGGQVLVQYFGPAETKVKADYVLNGIFNSLDFGNHLNADVRVGGIGPTTQLGWAQLTLTMQMDVAQTRMNRQTTVMTRSVRFTQLGVTSGKVFGSELVTGGVQVQDQQRLQFEAVNGPIALAVIDVIVKEFPTVTRCRDVKVAMK